jgi:hypothetical protein
MSRNAREKHPPVKKAPPSKRRASNSSSSLSDLSDDDGYSGVEDISDSEDEEAVYAAEEKHMISHAQKRKGVQGSPRPRPEEESEDDSDDSDSADDDGDDEAAAEEDDEDDEDSDEHDSGSGSWNGIASDAEDIAGSHPRGNGFLAEHETPVIERHVRFAGVSDSDSDSTTTDVSENHNDFFPDIFVDQESLDPGFRREIEYDPDETDSSNYGTFWDFEGLYNHITAQPDLNEAEASDSQDTTPTATPMASHQVSGVSTPVQSSPVEELDGYDSEFV